MRRDAGTVFVEAIISAAIVAFVLGAMLQAVAGGAGRERQVALRRQALLVAQSELADVGADIPLAEGESSGVAGDLVWRVEIAQYGDAGPANAAGALLQATVTVGERAGGPPLARLSTLRLAAAPV